MRKSILLFVLFTLTSIPLLLFAQGGYQVTGHIISAEDNQPMIGVSVLEKGTTNGVITDMNGNYSITVTKSPAILQFSYIGMKTMEKQVSAATRMNLKMESDAQMVEEVVVVAYGVRKKGTIAGSVSTVKAEKMEDVPAPSFDQALQQLFVFAEQIQLIRGKILFLYWMEWLFQVQISTRLVLMILRAFQC